LDEDPPQAARARASTVQVKESDRIFGEIFRWVFKTQIKQNQTMMNSPNNGGDPDPLVARQVAGDSDQRPVPNTM